MDAAWKMFCFFLIFQTTKEGVWLLWRFVLASTVVSCDGVLSVKEVGAFLQQGRLYKHSW